MLLGYYVTPNMPAYNLQLFLVHPFLPLLGTVAGKQLWAKQRIALDHLAGFPLHPNKQLT